MVAKNARRMNLVQKIHFAGTSDELQKKNFDIFREEMNLKLNMKRIQDPVKVFQRNAVEDKTDIDFLVKDSEERKKEVFYKRFYLLDGTPIKKLSEVPLQTKILICSWQKSQFFGLQGVAEDVQKLLSPNSSSKNLEPLDLGERKPTHESLYTAALKWLQNKKSIADNSDVL